MSGNGRLRVLVSGATGAQGGSVVEHLLKDNIKWKVQDFLPACCLLACLFRTTCFSLQVRALTRDPNSERAKALSAKGVEVVKGDLHNKDEIRFALCHSFGSLLMFFLLDIFLTYLQQGSTEGCKCFCCSNKFL